MSPEASPNYPAKPLSPQELIEVRTEAVPDEVFIAVNGLIAERLHGQYAQFTLKALAKRMEDLGLSKEEIKERNLTRVGSLYKQMGWEVRYHSPSMDDRNFDPYYTFGTGGPRSW